MAGRKHPAPGQPADNGEAGDRHRAVTLFDALLDANALIVGRLYDSDYFRYTLAGRGIVPCIPRYASRQ